MPPPAGPPAPNRRRGRTIRRSQTDGGGPNHGTPRWCPTCCPCHRRWFVDSTICFPSRARISQCCQDLRGSSAVPCTMRPAAVYKPYGAWMPPPAHDFHRYLLAGTHVFLLLVTPFVSFLRFPPPRPPSRRTIFRYFLPVPDRLHCRRGTGHPAHLVGRGPDYRDDSCTSGREATSPPPSARIHGY